MLHCALALILLLLERLQPVAYISTVLHVGIHCDTLTYRCMIIE